MGKTRSGSSGEGRRSLLQLILLQCFLYMVLFPAACQAASVVLDWDPSTDPDLAGYKVYYQAHSSAMPFGGSGAAEGDAPVDVRDVTSATISGLDAGSTYFFAVTAYNSAGVESGFSNILEVQESLAPSVTVQAPSGPVSGTVTVSATAVDNIGVAEVRFFINGEAVAARSAAPFSFQWDTASLPPGSYAISAKALDAAGNEGVSDPVVVTVAGDTVKPAVSLAAPAAPTAVSGSLVVSASATDDTAVTSLQLELDGAPLATGNQTEARFTLDTTVLANGSHLLCAKAFDAAGNAGEACVTLAVRNAVADLTPPVVAAFVIPASAGTLEVPVLLLAAQDSVGVTGYLLTESPAPPAADAPEWSPSVPERFRLAGAGTRTVYAWAKDAAGNLSAPRAATVAVTLPDTAAPVASITLPGAGTAVGGTVTVSLSASDDVAVSRLELYLNGRLLGTSTGSTAGFAWDTTTAANGTHTLTARAYDAAGNLGEAPPVTVTVENRRILSISDALTALYIAAGRTRPGIAQLAALDVAPIIGGRAYPDDQIDIADVVAILSIVVGKR